MPVNHIDTVIANAVTLANNLAAKAENAADKVLKKAETIRSHNFDYWKVEPIITADEMTPDLSASDNPMNAYEAAAEKLLKLAEDKLAEFLSLFYDPGDFNLVSLPLEIEEQIYQRARERIMAEGARNEKQVVTGYAARGFSLPPGMMLAQAQEIRVETLGRAGEVVSTIAAKVAEIEIENARFAIEQSIKARTAGIGAAADYVRAMMSGHETAAQVAGLNVDNRARMMAATADFYRARLAKDQIIINAQTARMQTSSPHALGTMDFMQGQIDSDVKAVVSAADVYARTASAALSSLNSIVSSSQASFG